MSATEIVSDLAVDNPGAVTLGGMVLFAAVVVGMLVVVLLIEARILRRARA